MCGWRRESSDKRDKVIRWFKCRLTESEQNAEKEKYKMRNTWQGVIPGRMNPVTCRYSPDRAITYLALSGEFWCALNTIHFLSITRKISRIQVTAHANSSTDAVRTFIHIYHWVILQAFRCHAIT